VRMHPREVQWHELLLRALADQGQATKPVESHYMSMTAAQRQKIVEDPDDPIARWKLGMVMSRFGGDDPSIHRGAGAVHQLRMAIRLAPEDAGIRGGLVEFLTSHCKDSDATEQAISVLEGASGNRWSRAVALSMRASLRAEQRGGLPADYIVKLYEEALEIDPAYAPAWLGLGRLLIVGDDPSRGRECLERALALDPFCLQARRARELLEA